VPNYLSTKKLANIAYFYFPEIQLNKTVENQGFLGFFFGVF
jgi:hypothetical protein